jgi:L-serine dehydratase
LPGGDILAARACAACVRAPLPEGVWRYGASPWPFGSRLENGAWSALEIDGFLVSFGGDSHTLIVFARDEPGTIATIVGIFAKEGVDLATMRVDRTGRHKDTLMTIEFDEPISDQALAEIRSHRWLHWARRIEKIA